MKKIITIFLLLLVVSCGTKHQSAKETKSVETTSERSPASSEDVEESVSEEYMIIEDPVMERAEEMISRESAYEIDTESEYRVSESISIEEQEANAVGNSGAMDISERSLEVVIDSIQVFVPENADGVGRLVYEIPTEMVKFQTYTIEVRIGENENDIRISANIQPTDNVVIRTSELMQVELVDPTGISFRIVSQSAQQLIEYDEYTTWIFYVTPLVHGENYISVVVSIVKNGNLKQTVYKDAVLVKTSSWIEVKTFVSNYWQWIVGFLVTVAIPFFIWLFKYFKKRKETS